MGSIDGFGLSPGITKDQRVGVENLMKNAVKSFPADLAGKYYPLTGMDEKVRQQLVDDHFLFVSGDRNLQVAGMERDWPEGRGIFHNREKTFLIWINEEDQLRIISMQKGGDVKQVFTRLAKGIKAVQESVKKESGKDFCLDKKYGYIHSCPTNLGTGMRASVHVDLQGWTEKAGVDRLQARCEELHLQPRGTRGESGGQTGHTYDISNKHRLGYSEVELVQKMIDGVNTLWKEDKAMMGGAAPPAAASSGSGDEEEVVVDQLLADLLVHASQRVVVSGKVRGEVLDSVDHELLNSNSLVPGDSRGQAESIDGTTNTDSARVDGDIRVNITLDLGGIHVRGVHSRG